MFALLVLLRTFQIIVLFNVILLWLCPFHGDVFLTSVLICNF